MKYSRISCQEFCRRLVRTRSAVADNKLHTPLKRCLNAAQLTLYCVAHMVGAGLYVLTGKLIRDYAGPAAFLSYLVAAIAAIFTALCYAEFTTLFPRAGSAYLYTYLMLGELPAFLIGWTMLSDVIVSTAAISKAFSGTVNLLTNRTITTWLENNLVNFGPSTILDTTPDLVAVAFLLLLAIVTLTGADISMNINVFLSSVQILSLIVLTTTCFVFGKQENYESNGGFFPFGMKGFLRGTGIAVFGFSGFEAIANASEEARNPRRDLPLALFSALVICAILYTGASLGLAYLVPRTAIVYDSPFVAAFTYVNQKEMMAFAAFATLLATGATKLVAMYVIPRFFYSIASDGLLFGFLAQVERRTQVPIWSLILGALLTMSLAAFIKIQILVEFTSVGILFSYFIIGIDLMILRYIFEDTHHVIDDGPSKKSDQLDDEDEGVMALLPPTDSLWLRNCVPECCKFLSSRTCFIIILSVYNLLVIMIGIFINVSVVYSLTWSWILVCALAAATVVCFILLCAYEPMKVKKGFETPLMPIAPCVTILTNGILITSLEVITWLRFVIWTVLGLLIYFAYGLWYSKADDDDDQQKANDNLNKESKFPTDPVD